MMQKVVYNASTGHHEDAERYAVVHVPEDVPANELGTYLAIHAYEVDGSIVGFSEAREILSLILDAEVGDANMKYKILMAFSDAVLNSFN